MLIKDKVTGTNTILGVVSYGYECASYGKPGYYARVDSDQVLPWIVQVLAEDTCKQINRELNQTKFTFVLKNRSTVIKEIFKQTKNLSPNNKYFFHMRHVLLPLIFNVVFI